MEVFGILLSFPVAAVASTACSYIVARLQVLNRGQGLAVVRFVSAAIQVSIIFEIVMLVLVGAVQIRTVVGPAFGKIHGVAFLGGVPALANLLVLGKSDARERWKYVVVPCTVLAFVLVIMEFHVYEALYGVDGVGGPFSAIAP